MYDRKHIERVLKINGLSAESSDEEISAVLFGARYREEEVMQALRVLRNDVVMDSGDQSKMAQKIMRTDKSLTAGEVSKLLGIDIPIDRFPKKKDKSAGEFTGVHAVVIAVLALLIAGMGVGLAMYAHGFGVFHDQTTATIHYDTN